MIILSSFFNKTFLMKAKSFMLSVLGVQKKFPRLDFHIYWNQQNIAWILMIFIWSLILMIGLLTNINDDFEIK